MSPGSPFSNVVGHDPENSTFTDVESPNVTDTTTATSTGTRPADTGTEPSVGVTTQPDGSIDVAEQDETAGDAASGRAPGQ